jgi:hypothetical protein
MMSNLAAALAVAGLWAGVFAAALMSGLWVQAETRRSDRERLRPDEAWGLARPPLPASADLKADLLFHP